MPDFLINVTAMQDATHNTSSSSDAHQEARPRHSPLACRPSATSASARAAAADGVVISVDKGTAFALPVGRRPRRSALVHLHVPGDASVILRVASKAVVAWPPRRNNTNNAATSKGVAAADSNADPHALYVCPNFASDGRCPRPDGACPYVHVAVAEEHTARLYPHRRCHAAAAAAATGARVVDPYRRFDASVVGGRDLLVTAPNGSVAGMRVAAADCLATQALDGGHDGALSLCAHYMGPKAVCDYGAECKFVHPAPGARMVRTRACDGPKLVAKATPPAAAPRATTAAAARRLGDEKTARFPHRTPVPSDNLVTSAAAAAAEAGAFPVPEAPAATVQRRYRHEPYLRRGWVPSASSTSAVVAPLPNASHT